MCDLEVASGVDGVTDRAEAVDLEQADRLTADREHQGVTALLPAAASAVGEVFAAHTVVSGLKVPFETTQKANGEVKAQSRLTSVTDNAGSTDDLFRRP